MVLGRLHQRYAAPLMGQWEAFVHPRLLCHRPALARRSGSYRRRAKCSTVNAQQPIREVAVPPTHDTGVEDLMAWADTQSLQELMRAAAALRDTGHPSFVTFSPKVFIPLTRLCRDSCGYCTFAQPPTPGRRAYMSLEEVLEVARLGAQQGCTEALFTLGDKPDLLYPEAAAELAAMGYKSTIEYVAAAAAAVLKETGLLPHINAGTMGREELRLLRDVSVSQGLMLEATSRRLLEPGGPHFNCPDKDPAVRLATIEAAGQDGIPFTTGILLGIGETRRERVEALLAIKHLNDKYGHIQEVIIQNFRAKRGTAMASSPEPPLEELLWTVALARLVLGPHISIQAPPNLTPEPDDAAPGSRQDAGAGWRLLLSAGINDWGGVSPLTRDWVNPEKPWPHLQALAQATAECGKALLPRLPVYPSYALQPGRWLEGTGGSASPAAATLRLMDSQGLARGSSWYAGAAEQQGERQAAEDSWVISASGSGPVAVQTSQTGEAAAVDLGPFTPQQQQQQQQQEQQQGRSMLAVRRRAGRDWKVRDRLQPTNVEKGNLVHALEQFQGYAFQKGLTPGKLGPPAFYDVQVAVGEDGLLEGCAGPEVSLLVRQLLDGVLEQGRELAAEEIEVLFAARGPDFEAVCQAADKLRQRVNGDVVTYVVNRNINYTNVCTYKCSFCAFSKGKTAEALRGAPYLLPLEEISRRTAEAWDRGATEVCMQGGIHPDFTGDTYLAILDAAKSAAPDIHVHAFSPLEVSQGAATLGWPLHRFMAALRDAGLGSLPGTAAEVLDDAVRAVLCPDKLNTQQWLEVVQTAHSVGLRTTSTIMFGHCEGSAAASWAAHLVALRELQRTQQAAAGPGASAGGITEFVPLPFVHMEAPIFLKGRARRGPTLRECVLMHAVARLALHPHITNIQASWVKMGPHRAAQLLSAGCNDMGGSLMNESITRAAGAAHGQELSPQQMEELILAAGRTPAQRTTLYGTPLPAQTDKSLRAAPLQRLMTGPARQH